MSKVLSVAKNEIKQQLRRKAIWIGFILIAAVIAFIAIPPTPKTVNTWICDDSTVCCFAAGNLKYFTYLIITVLCAGRLCNKKDNYYDILASTPLSKNQFYAGKIFGNTMLYGIFDFIIMIIFVPAYFINHQLAINGLIVPYFLIHFILHCLLIVLFGISFIAMLDLIFKNAIVSSVIGMLYFLICSNFQIMNSIPFGKYLLITNSSSYYNTVLQYFFTPPGYEVYLSKNIVNWGGYTPQNGFISIFVIIAFSILFYIIGLAIFKTAESSHFKLPKLNKKADAYGHPN